MSVDKIILAMAAVCLVVVIFMVMSKPFKAVLKFLLNVALGALAIFLANKALSPFDMYIGINVLTLGVVGVLGLPGFVSLIVMTALL